MFDPISFFLTLIGCAVFLGIIIYLLNIDNATEYLNEIKKAEKNIRDYASELEDREKRVASQEEKLRIESERLKAEKEAEKLRKEASIANDIIDIVINFKVEKIPLLIPKLIASIMNSLFLKKNIKTPENAIYDIREYTDDFIYKSRERI
jgi:hypothetical protein